MFALLEVVSVPVARTCDLKDARRPTSHKGLVETRAPVTHVSVKIHNRNQFRE